MVTPAKITFNATDVFDPRAMQDFMRRPDIYWSASDALAPPPESMDFISYMLHPDIWTVAVTANGLICGYVLFNKRTSIGAEIHTGFHPQFRGKFAKTMIEFAIQRSFKEKGLVKLWAIVPSDNRATVWLARSMEFRFEGRLRNAIVRRPETEGGPPLRDLLIFGREREGL